MNFWRPAVRNGVSNYCKTPLRRRKFKEQKIKAQQEQKERDLENLKIKEWEEKFDKEQKLMEEKERIKEEKLRLRDLEYQRSKNLDDYDTVKEELASKLESFDINKNSNN